MQTLVSVTDYQHSEKTTYLMEGNICELPNWWRVNIQTIEELIQLNNTKQIAVTKSADFRVDIFYKKTNT